MHDSLAVFGLVSGLLALVAFIPYGYTILRGHTKPEKAAWWIWTLLMLVAFMAQRAQGAKWSLVLTGTFLFCNLAIALLSLKHGYGRFGLKDILAACAVAFSLALWKYTDNPTSALLITIFIDFLGNWLTMTKSWRAPYTENLFTWFAITVASVFSLLAVGQFHSQKTIFPVYEILVNGICFGLIYRRRIWRSIRIKQGLKRR